MPINWQDDLKMYQTEKLSIQKGGVLESAMLVKVGDGH